MRFSVISIFPEFFDVLDLSLVGKAQAKSIIQIDIHNLRDWAYDVHRTVDDTPAGGGAGMVMRPDVWGRALDDVLSLDSADVTGSDTSNDQADDREDVQPGLGSRVSVPEGTVLMVPTPSGEPLTQHLCQNLADNARHLVFACGRYEGIDARVVDYYRQRVRVVEYSLGDYVLNGGEIAVVAVIEAVSRLLPGMVGNAESLVEESFSPAGLLEYPQYTRPQVWRGLSIPEVLTSGNHAAVDRLRRDEALRRTARFRPDMIEALDATHLNRKDLEVLKAVGFSSIDGHLRRERP
ncbi:MAG: tRNA (guanosine(37)-N1)-methyltransferase TrmD [Actinomycetaceae bacterium]|nr:tRNA (guanosine(37)-N1)-methyltransferase TrmD [Actinomycetaceae bacterium]MDY6082971.1 tRNA (guanosine(37)-N1)-methyltransferase TrmD [Actinomycetaceae bacterium]